MEESLSSSNVRKRCIGCFEELENDHLGILCTQGHDVCSTCAPNFVSEVMENCEANLPAKCKVCKQQIVAISFERQLDEAQSEIFNCYMAMKSIGKDEMLQSCPFCTYYILTLKKHTMNFLYCQGPGCEKMSCTVCKMEVTKIQENYFLNQEESKKAEEAEKHFKCWDLKEIKEKFDDAMDKGSKQFCPECKLGGMKDDACTHMQCPSCQTVWCYFCGLKDSACDKSKKGSIFRHNDQWNTNPKRCPMYFSQIKELDNKWPTDDEACLGFFHRLKTIQLLRAYVTEVGLAKYQELVKVFPQCGQATGFSIDTILKEDITMIKRK